MEVAVDGDLDYRCGHGFSCKRRAADGGTQFSAQLGACEGHELVGRGAFGQPQKVMSALADMKHGIVRVHQNARWCVVAQYAFVQHMKGRPKHCRIVRRHRDRGHGRNAQSQRRQQVCRRCNQGGSIDVRIPVHRLEKFGTRIGGLGTPEE